MMTSIFNGSVFAGSIIQGSVLRTGNYLCSYTTNATSQSADIKLSLPAGKKIILNWGDGSTTTIVGAVAITLYSHPYATTGSYNITVTGDYDDISYLKFEGSGSYGGDIKNLPSGLLYFYSLVANNLSGNIINLPSGLLKIVVSGVSTTITGNIQYLPSKLIQISLYGLNTLTGDIKNFFSTTTDIVLSGRNTIFGDLADLKDNVSFLWLLGRNTISDYSGKTWTTDFSQFKVTPYSGGLDSTEIDQLLIDLDDDLDWSGGGSITLTGTNAARTSASDAAVNNMISEGATITTN